MDPEPKALRPFILVATFFVILGCVATYYFWLLDWKASGGGASPRAQGETLLHPVAFLPQTTAADRLRLRGSVATLTKAGSGPVDPAAAASLVQTGEEAVPPLLDAVHKLSLDKGFSDPDALSSMNRIDRILMAISERLMSGKPALEVPGPYDREEAMKRAGAWFAWWDGRSAGKTAGPR